MPTSMLFILGTVLAGCIIVDVLTRRIPNVLSGPAILAGLALNALYFGGDGFLAGLAGCAGAIAILLVPFALGGVGAGDVKMMGAVGAFLGPRLALMALVIGMLLGGVVMAVHLARQGRLREKLGATATMLGGALMMGSLAPLQKSAADPGAIALPYSVPLGLGTIAAVAMSEALRF
jgi:prepilin peptidase CpaA